MKGFKFVTISLLSALLCTGGIAASAQSGGTNYPEDGDFIKSLTFTALTDYAVDGERYAFAENKTVYVYDDSNVTKYEFTNAITALSCSDSTFYCADGDGQVYSLPDMQPCEYELQPPTDKLISGSNMYYFDDEGALTVYNMSLKTSHTFEEGFGNLKQFGDNIYAVKENAVWSFSGETASEIQLEYYDYTVTQDIAVGDSVNELNNYDGLTFVTVTNNAHMTEIDLTELDGEFFVTGKTATAGEDTVALLLCYTGNAAIISIADTSYIVLKDNTEVTEIKCTSPAEFSNATITGNSIYSSPYVITEKPAVSDATGTIVEVVGKLEYEGVLGSVFYEVKYSAKNGSVKTGYVADGLLTEYIIEDNKDPVVVPDPDYSEKNNTKTILLVFAVIALVLAAIGYLAYVSTGGKSKNDKKSKDKKEGGEN